MSKNIPNFELCQQLKAAGYPQPTSEFGQFWYAEPHGRLCVSTNNGSKVGPGNPYFSETSTPSRVYGVTGFVYAPTVIEMAEYSKGRSNWQIKELFKLWADGEPTRQDIANDMARFVLWLIEWRKERDEYAAPVNIPDVGDAYQQGPHTVIKDKDGGFILSNTKVEDAVKLFESVKKFDEANPVPFYKTDEYKTKKEAQEREKAEKERIHRQNIFEPGNVILVCFGRDGDNVQDMLVLGHDLGLEHVKLQNKDGVSFWKKRERVFVKSILANINHPINPSVEHLIEAFLPKVNTYTAGEKIGANEPVFIDSSGKLMRSEGLISENDQNQTNIGNKEEESQNAEVDIDNFNLLQSAILNGHVRDELMPAVKFLQERGLLDDMCAQFFIKKGETVYDLVEIMYMFAESWRTSGAKVVYAIAGEELRPGEIVCIAPDGKIMRLDRPINPTEPTSK